MCLRCVGCGKCTLAAAAGGAGDARGGEELLARAREIGPSVAEMAELILRDARDEARARAEVAAVLALASRFAAPEIDRACAYALVRVPRPRCAYLRAVLESGAAG